MAVIGDRRAWIIHGLSFVIPERRRVEEVPEVAVCEPWRRRHRSAPSEGDVSRNQPNRLRRVGIGPIYFENRPKISEP